MDNGHSPKAKTPHSQSGAHSSSKLSLIDIGCNLTSPRLLSNYLRILADAADVGVDTLLLTGTDPESNQEALKLAEKHPQLFSTVGHHPHHANDWLSDTHPAALKRLAASPRVVAIGEMGLDYNRNFATHPNQRRCFEDQLAVAIETGKPIFLHERDAFDDFIEVLAPKLPEISGAVWHCFTGNREQLHQALDLGLYIGITGWICDHRRGKSVRDVVADIPDDRLMIETDAPYLTPKTIQPTPRTNEPKYLTYVLDMVAECRGQDRELVARLTTENARRFFGLPT